MKNLVITRRLSAAVFALALCTIAAAMDGATGNGGAAPDPFDIEIAAVEVADEAGRGNADAPPVPVIVTVATQEGQLGSCDTAAVLPPQPRDTAYSPTFRSHQTGAAAFVLSPPKTGPPAA